MRTAVDVHAHTNIKGYAVIDASHKAQHGVTDSQRN